MVHVASKVPMFIASSNTHLNILDPIAFFYPISQQLPQEYEFLHHKNVIIFLRVRKRLHYSQKRNLTTIHYYWLFTIYFTFLHN